MKKLLFITIMLLMACNAAVANEIFYDPVKEGEKKMVVSCTYPDQREDNSALPGSEIAQINFFVTVNGTRTAAGSNNAACSQTYTLSAALADGIYTYVAQTQDTGVPPLFSVDSASVVLTVKRSSPPGAPVGLSGVKQ